MNQADKQQYDEIEKTIKNKSPNLSFAKYEHLENEAINNVKCSMCRTLPIEEQHLVSVNFVNELLLKHDGNYYTKEEAINEIKEVLRDRHDMNELVEFNYIKVDTEKLVDWHIECGALPLVENDDEEAEEKFLYDNEPKTFEEIVDIYSDLEMSEIMEIGEVDVYDDYIEFRENIIFDEMRYSSADCTYYMEISENEFIQANEIFLRDMPETNQALFLKTAYEAIPERMKDQSFLDKLFIESQESIELIAEKEPKYKSLADTLENIHNFNERELTLKSFRLHEQLQNELSNKVEQKQIKQLKI